MLLRAMLTRLVSCVDMVSGNWDCPHSSGHFSPDRREPGTTGWMNPVPVRSYSAEAGLVLRSTSVSPAVSEVHPGLPTGDGENDLIPC